MVEKDLIFNNMSFNNRFELLDFMSDKLFELGYVTEDFKEKIKEREENYPTGLMLQSMNVAICHADPEYVIENKIVAIKLSKPVIFRNIETLDDLEVEFVFGLIFKDGDSHINNLSKLAQVLVNDENIQEIKNSDSVEDIYSFMIERLV